MWIFLRKGFIENSCQSSERLLPQERFFKNKFFLENFFGRLWQSLPRVFSLLLKMHNGISPKGFERGF